MRNEKQKGVLFLLLFSMVFFGTYVCAYGMFSWYGKSYIWYYDGLKQHFASLVYLGRYYRELAVSFLHGDFTLPLFDFSLGMGEDIITTLNFYGLGDPLTLLAAFVPEEKMEALYHFLVVFRIYLAGLSFAWMCRKRGKDYGSTFTGALIYAFSGYVLHVAVKHPFFIIPMIFLPLSVVGVERVLEKKKRTLLIVLVFFTALNGFYFFYMNTVFLVIYALVRMICQKWGIRDMLRGTARCAMAYGTGTAMAAVIFLPAFTAFLGSARSESAVNPGNLLCFGVDRYASIFARVIGVPRITWDYLGLVSLVFPALVVLFSGRFRENRELKVNIIIWTALMLLPFGGYLLNGCSYVSGRFLYLTTFVYVLGTVEVIPALFRLNRKRMCICAVAACAYGAVVAFSRGTDALYDWFGLMMLILTLVVLFTGSVRQIRQKWMFVALMAVVVLNISVNAWGLFVAQGYLSEFEDRGTALATLQESPEAGAPAAGGEAGALAAGGDTGSTDAGGENAGASVAENDDADFFRTDALEKSSENAALVNGNYGVSSYFSISNPNRITYLQEIEDGGVLDSMFKISGLDGRAPLLALASVKYYAVPEKLSAEGAVPYGYKKVKEYKRGGKTYGLYENKNFLPLGITFDSYMEAADIHDMDGLVKQDLMLETVVLEEEVPGVAKRTEYSAEGLEEVPFTVQPSEHVSVTGDEVCIEKGGASVTLEWEGTEEGEYYVRFGPYHITRENYQYCDIMVKRGKLKKTVRALKDTWNWYFGRETHLLNIGLMNAGGQGGDVSAEDTEKGNSCRIQFQRAGTFRREDLKVYVQKPADYEETLARRCEDVLEQVETGKNRVSGEISLKENKLLFLSIPYSEGWRAKVDGKETRILQADTAYMALKLEPGSHRVELEYMTPGLKAGAVLTLAGCLVFAGYEWWERRRGRRGQ